MACASLLEVELDGDRKGGYDERTSELALGWFGGSGFQVDIAALGPAYKLLTNRGNCVAGEEQMTHDHESLHVLGLKFNHLKQQVHR